MVSKSHQDQEKRPRTSRPKGDMEEKPTVEQIQALLRFAKENGRYWKSALRHSWETGIYTTQADSSALQQVRNIFGPTWLTKFNPKNGWEQWANSCLNNREFQFGG